MKTQAAPKQPLFQPQQSEQISIEMTKQILEKLFDLLQDYQKKLPYTHDPPGLKTRLLPYQRQGLGWLRKREVSYQNNNKKNEQVRRKRRNSSL